MEANSEATNIAPELPPEQPRTLDQLVLDAVRKALPAGTPEFPKYKNIRPFRQGGSKKVMIAEWGPHEEQRIIYADLVLGSVRNQRYHARGCNTGAELHNIAAIPNPQDHHLLGLNDFEFSTDLANLNTNYSGVITVVGFFDGQPLHDVAADKPLDRALYCTVFDHVFEAERYLLRETGDKGMLHRDISPGNILVKQNGEIEAVLTDYANAAPVDDPEIKAFPTSGAKFVMDPLLIAGLVDKPMAHYEGSELYSLGKCMLYALTGMETFEVNPDEMTATNLVTGESLLDEKTSKIDTKKYGAAIDQSLDLISPDMRRRFGKVIKKLLQFDPNKRYSTIEEAISDFNHAQLPTFRDKIKKKTTDLAFGTLLTAAGLAALGLTGYEANKRYHLVDAAKKNIAEFVHTLPWLEEPIPIPLIAEWNLDGLELSNGLVQINAYAYVFSERHSPGLDNQNNMVESSNNNSGITLSKKDILHVVRGESISGSVNLIYNAGTRTEFERYLAMPGLHGRVYIEGFESESIFVYPVNFNREAHYNDFHGYNGGMFGYPVPSDIKDGVYNFVIEFDAPRDSDIYREGISRALPLKIGHPGKWITRETIPVYVGEELPDRIMNLERMHHGPTSISNVLGFQCQYDPMASDKYPLQMLFSMPGTEYTQIINSNGQSNLADFSLELPKPANVNSPEWALADSVTYGLTAATEPDYRILTAVMMTPDSLSHNGKPEFYGYSFLPVSFDSTEFFSRWNPELAGPEFHTYLVGLREKIYNEIDDQQK